MSLGLSSMPGFPWAGLAVGSAGQDPWEHWDLSRASLPWSLHSKSLHPGQLSRVFHILPSTPNCLLHSELLSSQPGLYNETVSKADKQNTPPTVPHSKESKIAQIKSKFRAWDGWIVQSMGGCGTSLPGQSFHACLVVVGTIWWWHLNTPYNCVGRVWDQRGLCHVLCCFVCWAVCQVARAGR